MKNIYNFYDVILNNIDMKTVCVNMKSNKHAKASINIYKKNLKTDFVYTVSGASFSDLNRNYQHIVDTYIKLIKYNNLENKLDNSVFMSILKETQIKNLKISVNELSYLFGIPRCFLEKNVNKNLIAFLNNDYFPDEKIISKRKKYGGGGAIRPVLFY